MNGDCFLEVEEAEDFTAWAVVTKEFERAQNMITQKFWILNYSVMWLSKLFSLDNVLSSYYTIWN